MTLKEIVEKLTMLKMTISAMESCTGGGFSNALTNIEGASEVLKFSAVTYSNEYKIKFGVSKDIIDKHSVYSFEVADEMSLNISKFTGSNIGVGITGKLNRIDVNNPYGDDNIVYISVYDVANNKFHHKKAMVTKRSRAENKNLVIECVVEILNEILK